MWRVFHEAGLGRKVSTRSARAIYLSYRRRGLASRHDPQVGDLIVWGRGSHVGVYIGRGYAISALVQGVRVHRVRAMFTPFTAYLHTHLSGLEKPAWELQLAKHIRSLRHATRTVFLHEAASRASATAGTLRSGVKFVVLARRRDGRHRLWLHVLTFGGRTGWVPATATAR
jgi:cell wall-associated NlpC family hydrolase